MGRPVRQRSCPLRCRLIALLAKVPTPKEAHARAHLLAALRDFEAEGVANHRPAATLQAIRSAIGTLGASGSLGRESFGVSQPPESQRLCQTGPRSIAA